MPVYTYKRVMSINRDCLIILCKEKIVSISFADCVRNYAKEMGDQNQGIGTRDVTKLQFTFYTDPKTIIVWKKPRFFQFWRSYKKFIQLQKAIKLLGYQTLDLS